MRRPLLLLAFAAAAGAAPKPRVAAADLPVVRSVSDFPEPSPFVSVTVELDARGGLHVDGSRVTLNEVGARLVRATEERAVFLRRQGLPPRDPLPSGLEGSAVQIHLRVHREAPWRHVQWLLTLAGEERAYKTAFVAVDAAGKEGLVAAWLPLGAGDAGGFEVPEEGEEETAKAPREKPGVLTVTLVAEGEREGSFAGRPVRAPASVAFAVGKRKTGDREKFRKILPEELLARRPKIVEIRAEGRIPAGEVVGVLGEVRAEGYESLDVYRPLPLPRPLRGQRDLPYPEPAAVR